MSRAELIEAAVESVTTNRLNELPSPLRAGVVRQCERSCNIHRGGDPTWLCYLKNHACRRCQENAQAMLATIAKEG